MISQIASNIIKSSYKSIAPFSVWANVPMGPADPVLGVAQAFKKDSAKNKVNLGIGAYRDDDGKPVVLDSVRRAQKLILESNPDNEYYPVHGSEKFLNAATLLAYGPNSKAYKEKRIAAHQVLSGTGALRLGFDFFSRFLPKGTAIYMPAPTWQNHHNIAKDAHLAVKEYRYFDPKTKGVNFDGLTQDLKAAPEGSVILLHACAHNPTGCDLSVSQWNDVVQIFRNRRFVAYMDSAYQGFTSGNVDTDAYAIRLFESSGIPFALGQSFAQNMGLYGQRIGALSFITKDSQEAERVLSQLQIIARPIWSNPPLHGARIAETILTTPELNTLWLGEVQMMADRITLMRQSLVKYLKQAGSPHNWDHITKQIGMFAFTGLKEDMVKRLISEYHIYLLSSGRISLAGLNTKNVKYVAEAFHEVSKNGTI